MWVLWLNASGKQKDAIMLAAFSISSEGGSLGSLSSFSFILNSHRSWHLLHPLSLFLHPLWMVDRFSMQCVDRSSPHTIYHAVYSKRMWARSLEHCGIVGVWRDQQSTLTKDYTYSKAIHQRCRFILLEELSHYRNSKLLMLQITAKGAPRVIVTSVLEGS